MRNMIKLPGLLFVCVRIDKRERGKEGEEARPELDRALDRGAGKERDTKLPLLKCACESEDIDEAVIHLVIIVRQTW